jgi:hypothetical protein
MFPNLAQQVAVLGFFKKKATKVFVFSLLAVFIVLVFFIAWRNWTNPARRGEYEGRIVDRWADQAPSTEVSHPHFHLVIESADGKRFTVNVDPTVYESARVGMRIRSRNGQVVLIDSPQSPVNK